MEVVKMIEVAEVAKLLAMLVEVAKLVVVLKVA